LGVQEKVPMPSQDNRMQNYMKAKTKIDGKPFAKTKTFCEIFAKAKNFHENEHFRETKFCEVSLKHVLFRLLYALRENEKSVFVSTLVGVWRSWKKGCESYKKK
jgi:hypothetical protein